MKTNLRNKEVVTNMGIVGIVKKQDDDGVTIALSGLEDEYVEEYVYFENIEKIDGVKPKFASTAMKDEVESQLIQLFNYIGMGILSNYEDIVQYVYEYILDDVGADKWHHSDVVKGLQKFIESK